MTKVCGVCLFKKLNFDLDELPFLPFEKMSLSDLNCLPPSTDALVVHTFRCAYQNAWI